jgi:hypothetical protein
MSFDPEGIGKLNRDTSGRVLSWQRQDPCDGVGLVFLVLCAK